MTHGSASDETYARTGIDGCISLKKRTQTGVTVAVVKTVDSKTPRYGSKYFVQCQAHRTKRGHSTRRKAIVAARVPAEWCNQCAAHKQADEDGGSL